MTTTRSLPAALVVAARPKQWLKNVLVFIAPAAAGVLGEGSALVRAIAAFVAFCAASSATYLLNDAGDVESDRRHPVKRHRPVARGEVSPALARSVGVVLMALSLGVSILVNKELTLVVASYLVLTTLYSAALKDIAVVDIVAVAAGFLLRAVGGGVATEVPISAWFYIVAGAASLFVVAAKRLAELRMGGDEAHQTRASLASYTTAYLAYVLAVTSGIAILAYCLWAFEIGTRFPSEAAWFELSIIPFASGVLRYALLVDAGGGGEPEELVLHDVPLQVIGLAWVLLFGIGIYVR
jgi:decaprenyl-phosphate phosphoribosyltransferase